MRCHSLNLLVQTGNAHFVTVLILVFFSPAIIFLFRNKEEGYFIASELLKRICKTENGAQAIRKSSAILKRLNNLAEELTRKAGNDKR